MKHGYLQEEKGPEDMRGAVLREVEPRNGAINGYAKWRVDFWPSVEAYDNDQPGFDGQRKSGIEKRFLVHESAAGAIEAVKQEFVK